MTFPLKRVLGASAACLLGAYSCLPKDVRPPPGSVYITLSGDDAVTQGFVSDDGWSVSYSRFLISLGHTSLASANKGCVSYGDSNYSRVSRVDDRVEPQKVSISSALGHCEVAFRVSNPGNNPVRSPGVTAEDVDFMRTPGRDAWVAHETGVSLYVEGSATKGGVTKHFAWSFRQNIRYSACGIEQNGQFVHGYALGGDDAFSWNILLRGRTLFWDHTDQTLAHARFAPFAEADDAGNADGQVTFEELAAVPIAGIGTIDPPPATGETDAGDDAGDAGALDAAMQDGAPADAGLQSSDATHYCASKVVASLGDYVYLRLVPIIPKYRDDTGECNVDETCVPGRVRGL